MGDQNNDLKKTLEEALSEMDEKGDTDKAAQEKRAEEMKTVQKRLEEKLKSRDTETVSKPEREKAVSESGEPEPAEASEPENPESEAVSEPKEPEPEAVSEPEEPEQAEASEPEKSDAEVVSETGSEEAGSEETGPEEAALEETEPEEVESETEAAVTKEAAEEAEQTEAAKAEAAAKAKKKKSNRIYNLVIAIGVCMVLGGGFAVFQKYKNDADTKKMYTDLENEFVTVSNENETETEVDWGFDWVSADGSSSYTSTVWYEKISVDFDGLNNINEDVVGWIYQENGEISYPILYSGDNEQYLRHTLYNVESTSGSIFLGGDNHPDMSDDLIMIYGHNMKNGSMFGSLKQYKEDDTYYADHQYFQIYTEDGMAYRYQVYAYFDIDDNELAMEDLLFYDSEDESSAIVTEVVIQEGDDTQEEITSEVILNEENTYAAYLETIASRTKLDTDIEVTTEDQVLGLWTCTASGTKRFLVFAVKVDEHNFNEEEETQAQDLNALDR